MRQQILGLGRVVVRVGRAPASSATGRLGCVGREGFSISSRALSSPPDSSSPVAFSASPATTSTSSSSTRTSASATPISPPYNPLSTYNVTKADAKPIPSTHHALSFDAGFINVPWEEGLTSRFHNFWLRDHCHCHSCRDPRTGQRILDTWRLSVDVRPVDVETVENADGEKGMKIKWDDGHESFFPWGWLHLHSYNPRLEKYFSPRFKLWGGKEILEQGLPEVEYAAIVEGEKGMAEWTRKIYDHGICFVRNVPPTPEATEELIARLGPIRNTHYGGFYDFTSDLSHGDLAYTNVALPAHTDTTYFTDPCGLQFFHCLSHEGSGGKSLFVDGFRAAQILRKEHPEEYKILSRITISAHASGDKDVSVRPTTAMPTFVHDDLSGELLQVRWNNEDRATMDRVKGEDVLEWYRAARVWEKILRREDSELWVKLEAGTLVGFDNWRVLHGREAFDGKRRMCGAYISRDDFYSRYLITNAGRAVVLRAI